MAKDMRMLERKTIGIVDENVEENELMLELSIGGIFGRSNRNGRESVEKDVPATEALNVQSKREIQAFRRRELRRKREEKLKKSVGFGSCGSVSGPFLENKEWLDEVLEIQPARKRERNGNLPENIGSISAAAPLNGFVNHNVMQVCGGGEVVARIDDGMNRKNSVFRPTACRSFRPYQANRNLKGMEDEIEGGGGRNGNVNSSGSAGCASSAFSDSQCSSRQGGATDDSRSNSSNSQLDQQLPTTSAASDPSDHDLPTDSSKPIVSTNNLTDSTVCNPGPLKPNDQSTPPNSSLSNPPSKLDSATQQASFLAQMPCVSTTGNGPNGKTLGGFLYRYTKNEVSIVCVCHGQSFSPAGFVEHAGGVDIAHPLKHITIFPTAFAS